jgi:hypothetical protein
LEVTVEYVGSKYELTPEPVSLAWMPSGGKERVEVGVRGLPPPESDLYGMTAKREEPPFSDFRARGHYLDRLARPVTPPILDWVHDELPPSG